jgi:hypothetical protein
MWTFYRSETAKCHARDLPLKNPDARDISPKCGSRKWNDGMVKDADLYQQALVVRHLNPYRRPLSLRQQATLVRIASNRKGESARNTAKAAHQLAKTGFKARNSPLLTYREEHANCYAWRESSNVLASCTS